MPDAPTITETASRNALNALRSIDSPPPAVARSESDRPSAESSATGPLASTHPATGLSVFKPSSSRKKCPVALAAEITTLAGHLNAAQYRFLKLLDEFDREQGWAGPGVRSLAHWLSWKCGIGELVAREKVRVARALRELPMIDASFERGEISYSKVRAMTRAATPENEAQLLNIARHGTAEHMERLVRVYRQCRKRAETSPGETERRREERFYCFDEDEETTVFGGRVSAEQGRLLMKALDAMVAEMEADEREADAEIVSAESPSTADFREKCFSGNFFRRSGPVSNPTNPTSPIGGPSSPCACAAPPHWRRSPSTTSPPAAATPAPRRSDRAMPTRSSCTSTPTTRIRTTVINGGHTTYTDDRRCLAPHVARQLACDASRRTVLENERGEVLNIGRRSRIVPWHIAHTLADTRRRVPLPRLQSASLDRRPPHPPLGRRGRDEP